MVMDRVTDEQKLITGEELIELGGLGRSELVEGRIVRMSPTGDSHGSYEGNFFYEIRKFVDAYELGKVRVGEVGIYTQRNPDTVRGADVLFISNERYAQKKSTSFLDVAPDLIVEILSPHDRWNDVMTKLREYFEIGVRLVWVADPQGQIVYAYRAITEVTEYLADDTLSGEEVLPGFSVPVSQLFEL